MLVMISLAIRFRQKVTNLICLVFFLQVSHSDIHVSSSLRQLELQKGEMKTYEFDCHGFAKGLT